MHLKHRIEFRKQISKFAAAIERSRQESATCKKFYTYISNSSYTPPAKQLYIGGEWVRGKDPVLEAEDGNLSSHMSGRADTFHYDGANEQDEADDCRLNEAIVTNPFCILDEAGGKMRQQLADPDNNNEDWKKSVPKETHSFFELGKKMVDSSEYGDMFQTEIKFEKFKRYLGYK